MQFANSDIFRLRPQGRRLTSWFYSGLERITLLRNCGRLYGEMADIQDAERFLEEVLERLRVRGEVKSEEMSRIPNSGPCVVVANHPFGGVEGLMLIRLLLAIRPDVRVMANCLLGRIPQLANLFIQVDPFGRKISTAANITPLRKSIHWVREGGMLLVFPAGTVSHLQLRRRQVTDPPWSPTIGRVIHRVKAPVVPLFVHGKNGLFFQAAGLIHPWLRTLLLPRQLFNKKGRTIKLSVGRVLPYREKLARFTEDAELMNYLRMRTYVLRQRAAGSEPVTPDDREALDPPVNRHGLERELACLSRSQYLARSGELSVWHSRADRIPALLTEIGRLREFTFRRAGEGSGQPVDLDEFDEHYEHLFIWNETTREVVGAYRIGRTDEILKTMGMQGLYTSTLFRFRTAFFRHLGPALELGRSFVRPEYQKSYAPLLLLWKGIGAYLTRNPRYRKLFGPVSISRDYCDFSRHLIASALYRFQRVEMFKPLVRPRNPLRHCRGWIRIPGCDRGSARVFGQDLDELSSVVGDVELDQKGIPILLRQYLKLGGKLLAFNVDTDFSNVLDGLLLVDLHKTDRRQLDRYMTRPGANAFLSYRDPGVSDGCG